MPEVERFIRWPHVSSTFRSLDIEAQTLWLSFTKIVEDHPEQPLKRLLECLQSSTTTMAIGGATKNVQTQPFCRSYITPEKNNLEVSEASASNVSPPKASPSKTSTSTNTIFIPRQANNQKSIIQETAVMRGIYLIGELNTPIMNKVQRQKIDISTISEEPSDTSSTQAYKRKRDIACTDSGMRITKNYRRNGPVTRSCSTQYQPLGHFERVNGRLVRK